MTELTTEHLATLREYSACDISDALLAINKSEKHAGYLVDIHPYNPSADNSTPIIFPASTVIFVPSRTAPIPDGKLGGITHTQEEISDLRSSDSLIPSGTQWSDLTITNTIVIISQPPGQTNAAVGGIHALRCEMAGAKGLLIDGRIRDLREMEVLRIPVFAKNHSTVGAGAGCTAMFLQRPIKIGDVEVKPGDLIFLDPTERAAVCIPRESVEKVVGWLKSRGDREELVKRHVSEGGSVAEAFRLYR